MECNKDEGTSALRNTTFVRHPDTFLTSCSGCKRFFVYEKRFINHILICPVCRKPFPGMEMHPPPSPLCWQPFPNPYHLQTSTSGFSSVPSNEQLRKSTLKGKEAAASTSQVKELSRSQSRARLVGIAKASISGLLRQEEENTKYSLKMEQISECSSGDNNESIAIEVPDADFHNFDGERIESSFSENEIWAAYDEGDGMPRLYALVHNVISRDPFKMKISWLNSESTCEYGSLDWIGSGFTKTCGDYTVGECVINGILNCFSHPVKCKKGPGGVIQVYPTKGDVWAVYKNWSNEIVHQYDVVVVVEDYNGDVGSVVAPLLKVPGFKSVFSLDRGGSHTIPREEMFRFSHQVPCHILNGGEGENAPKGCYDLDPAALHSELLKVISA